MCGGSRMTFEEILGKLNDLDFSGGQTYFICNRNNPQNYMEVSAGLEMLEDRQFVNTEFKVFNEGIQQKCDVFPHGKFTHYTKADGTNSTEYGAEYWEKMKQQIKEKGGFSDDLLIFSDLQNYQFFAETGQIEQQNIEITKEIEQTVSSPEAEQLFETFKAAEEETNVKVAKQQDVIAKLQAKIEDTIRSQNRQNQTVTACETLLQSNAYPKLNPLITAFSDSTKKSSENKKQKIKKLKKKIKKAEKKIRRLKQKQKKNDMFKEFISSLFDKNTDRSAYIAGMQALREDSYIRAERKLDRTESALEKIKDKLTRGNLSSTQAAQLKIRIKKLENRKTKIQEKIKNLIELDQSLNKLAQTEISAELLEEIKEATVHSAAGKGIISQAVDGMTSPDVTSTIKKAMTEEVKEEETIVSPVSEDEKAPTEEKPVTPEHPPDEEKQDNGQQEETPAAEKKPAAASKVDLRKRDHLTDKEFQAVIDAGLPIRAKKVAENDITVIFDVSHTAQLDQAIASTKIQMPSVKR